MALAVAVRFVPPARASVAVLVEEPYGDMARMNPTGHSAVYLDHVCAESPIKLRPCVPGELGVVISRYKDIGGYDWLATPLLGYLYAVDSVDQIPATVDKAAEDRIRDAYRREHFLSIAPNREDGSTPDGDWYELAGSAYDRTLYGFQVKTTPEQDAKLMALFNDRRNKQRYNGAFRNCADFARVTINRFYPYAVKRNFIADLGITTPKQVGHALSKYGKHHPEAGLTEFVVPQIAGSLPRSHTIKGVTESLLTRKRYVVPITVIQPVLTGILFVAYMGNGRFEMPKDAPVLSLSAAPQILASSSVASAPDADGDLSPADPAMTTPDSADQPDSQP
ncbi:MAG TPA: hypothetical protein VIJ79_09620 [Acidobacteriaceae bacterium]